jgi:threonine synthase
LSKNIIKYYSTNRKSPEVTFCDALLKGLAPDGGLYLPVKIPSLSSGELKDLSRMEYPEIAFTVLNKFLANEINEQDLRNICSDSYNFDVPLEKVSHRKYILRLDRGPTASFKDFAARLMSRLMQYFLASDNQHITILTATSGDTGSAVANAFYGLNNIKVIILFPDDEVSPMQRKQMTTLKKNISVMAVKGKFDDCQQMVKKAFSDPYLAHIPLSSANSINIGRLLPQSVYYFYAWSKLAAQIEEKAVYSVPSGNFGNLMGGLIAFRMGLPVEKFIISTNENNEVPQFLLNGIYTPVSPSKNCISSAMNVGHPSNLARIIALYNGMMNETGVIVSQPDITNMRHDLFGTFVSDETTRETMREIFRKYKILLEPHGAVAWQGIKEYSKTMKDLTPDSQLFISLETAHPGKFPEEIRQILNVDPLLPSSLIGLADKEESFITIENDYPLLKDSILKYSKLD